MAIDDALDTNKTSSAPAQISADLTQTMRHYLWCIDQYVQSMPVTGFSPRKDYSLSKINQFAGFLRFDDSLRIGLCEISKDFILNALRGENPDLAYIVENTDLSRQVLDLFDNGELNMGRVRDLYRRSNRTKRDKRHSYINSDIDIVNSIGLSDLTYFMRVVDNNKFFTIPDYAFLSLFVEKGSIFRQYISVNEIKTDKPILVYSDGCDPSINFNLGELFSASKLKKFYDATKIKDVSKMITDVKEFAHAVHTCHKKDLRKRLYEILRAFSPDFTFKAESVNERSFTFDLLYDASEGALDEEGANLNESDTNDYNGDEMSGRDDDVPF